MFEQPKRALVVEDEAKTAAFLRDGLQDQGWKVDIAKDGSEGLRLARSSSHDLLLLDIMLPTLDGWTILQRLRAEAVLTPLIFLTARDELADRIKGLDLGADDYLVKPFAFSELLARIRSILRRGSGPPANQNQNRGARNQSRNACCHSRPKAAGTHPKRVCPARTSDP